MRKLIYKALRLFLAFKVLSFLSDRIAPYVKDNKVIFPTDAKLRVKVAWLVIITFIAFVAAFGYSVALLIAVVRFALSRIRPSKG